VPPPTGFPRRILTPPETELLFRTRHPPCQRKDGSPRASSPFLWSALRLAAVERTRCVRSISASPLPDYEHPCLVSYRHLFEARASPLAVGLAPATRRPVDLAFHDAESASVGPLGLPRNVLLCAIPIKPYLWHPRHFLASGPALSCGDPLLGCQGRFPRLSVKMRRSRRPEVPSIAGGHPRARVDRRQARMRSRVLPQWTGLSAPLHTRFLRAPLSRFSKTPPARPSSPFTVPHRGVSAERRQTLLRVRLPPNDFCNYTSDARTHSRASDSRRHSAFRFTR